MICENKMDNFRSPVLKNYPELKDYSPENLYENFIGCGGLYLAVNMIRRMNIKKGDIILDLGCGLGSSSLFLAKIFDVRLSEFLLNGHLFNPKTQDRI